MSSQFRAGSKLALLLIVVVLLAGACGPTPEPQTVVQTIEVEKTVVETVEVERQVIQTVEVEKTVVEEKVVEVTAVPEPPGPEGTLTMAITTFPNSVLPASAADIMAGNVMRQIFESLVWINDEGEVAPALAETWDTSEDGTEYTFHLRQGVTFHNGEPFTADSVLASWKRVTGGDFPYGYEWARVESVEKIDDYTVKMTTSEPDALLLRIMAAFWGFVPPKYYQEVGEEGLAEKPVGTGPFMFVEWVEGDHIILEANPNYWGEGLPKVQTVIFRPIPESATRVAAIQTGEVDVVQRLTSGEAESLLGAPNVKILQHPTTHIFYIAFNNLTTGVGQPTENPLVRQAMNYAVDVDAIIDALFDGYGQPASGLVASGEMAHGIVEPFGYDPDRAKELLSEAGYPDGFTIGFACPAGAYAFFEQVCEAIQGYLSEVGIDAELEVMESGQYWSLEAEKELPPMFGDGWSSPLGEAYARLFGTLGGWDASYSSWSDPKIDELLRDISQAVNSDEREKLYEDLQIYMHENPPFIYLYQPVTFEATNTRVQNYFSRNSDEYYLMNTWVIPEE